MKSFERVNLKRNIKETFEELNNCINDIDDIETFAISQFNDMTKEASDTDKLDAVREICFKHSMLMSELIFRVERNIEALLKNTMSKTSKLVLNEFTQRRLNDLLSASDKNEAVKYFYCLENYTMKQLKQCIRNEYLKDLDNDFII